MLARRPSHRIRARLSSIAMAALALALPLALTACDSESGPNDNVARVEVNLAGPTLLIGTNATAQVRAFDISNNEITGVTAKWKSSNAAVATVSDVGVLFGVAIGDAIITATVGRVSATAEVSVVPIPVNSITITPGGGPLDRGQSLQLRAVLRDQFGEIIENRPVTWTSSAGGIASVSGAGLVAGIAAGTAIITAMTEEQSASVTINVIVTPAPGGPSITAITPSLLVPGGTATVFGTNFGATPATNEVRIAGVLATVTVASTTELTLQVPVGDFGCEPTREVFVQVVRGNVADAKAHPLQALAQRTLLPGESVVLSNAADARCVELSATGGTYVVSVYNAATSNSSLTEVAFRLRGARGMLPPGVSMAPLATTTSARSADAPIAVSSAAELRAQMRDVARREQEREHLRILQANIDIIHANRHDLPHPGAASAPRLAAITAAQPVGSVVSMKVPDLNGPNGICTDFFPVSARVAYNGTRAILVEDIAAPLAGQVDSIYTRMGQEFDNISYDIVRQNFSDPLRLDAQLDNNGKIIMVFSHRINQTANIAGFVVNCDFLQSSASSNHAEVFYARVPTATGSDPESFANVIGWQRQIRSTVIHETKHIAAFANRIADFGSLLEEPWLEEGTARHAEELWARVAAYGGLLQKANATYEQSVFCDFRPTGGSGGPQCVGAPFAMARHFERGGLHDYLRDNETRSPLGQKVGFFETTYYASAWSLVRWGIDNHQIEEAAFLTALTRTNQTGVANLVARLGRPWEEVVGEWSLALYLDDLPGFTPVNTRLRMPSWNLRSIFFGLYTDFASRPGLPFPFPFPLQPRQMQYGDFSQSVPRLAGGSFAMFQFSGPQTGRQLLQLLGANSAQPPAALRMAIVRVN